MAGKKGFGAIFAYGVDITPSAYTPVGQITKVKPYSAKADVIDMTSHDSPSQYREKVSGLLEAGAVSLDINFDDKNAGHKWFLANLGVDWPFKITGPGASPAVLTFRGFVKEVGPEIPHDNKMSATVSIEINGVVTVT